MLVMTETVQDYLKAIWMLDRSGNVTTSALAERLGLRSSCKRGRERKTMRWDRVRDVVPLPRDPVRIRVGPAISLV